MHGAVHKADFRELAAAHGADLAVEGEVRVVRRGRGHGDDGRLRQNGDFARHARDVAEAVLRRNGHTSAKRGDLLRQLVGHLKGVLIRHLKGGVKGCLRILQRGVGRERDGRVCNFGRVLIDIADDDGLFDGVGLAAQPLGKGHFHRVGAALCRRESKRLLVFCVHRGLCKGERNIAVLLRHVDGGDGDVDVCLRGPRLAAFDLQLGRGDHPSAHNGEGVCPYANEMCRHVIVRAAVECGVDDVSSVLIACDREVPRALQLAARRLGAFVVCDALPLFIDDSGEGN